MSATAESEQILWVICENAENQASLLALPVDNGQLGVILFTKKENAEDFAASFPDLPDGAVIGLVSVEQLPIVLTEQAQRGRRIVVTDPIYGVEKWNSQHTLSVDEYLARLGRSMA